MNKKTKLLNKLEYNLDVSRRSTILLIKNIKLVCLKQQMEVINAHRLGIMNFETWIFTESEYASFKEEMENIYKDLLQKHAKELRLVHPETAKFDSDYELLNDSMPTK
jgi:hypothetical protein